MAENCYTTMSVLTDLPQIRNLKSTGKRYTLLEEHCHITMKEIKMKSALIAGCTNNFE